MKKILGTLVVALLLGTPVLAQPVIVGDPTSANFGAVTDSDNNVRNYMWFNILLSNTGSGSPAGIGGVSLAAQVGGPWAAAHLTAPPNFGTGGANSDNRFTGLQWAAILGTSASNYAFGTNIVVPGTADYPTSTSGAFGTIGSGGFLTFGIDNQYSVVTPVSNGMILARLYFGWDGTPLGANSVSVSLIAESGNPTQGPSIFAASSLTSSGYTVIGSEAFSAPSSFVIAASVGGTFNVAATTTSHWVYQNTTATTKNRHAVPLTMAVSGDTWGNTSYTATVTVTPTPSGTYQGLIVSSTSISKLGSGSLTPTSTCAITGQAGSATLFLVGGPVLSGGQVTSALNKSVTKQSGKPTSGQYSVSVAVAGNVGGTVTATPVTITLLLLGDVRANGLITGTNASYVNLYLGSSPKTVPSQVGSGSPDSWSDPSLLDITGQGTVIGTDASLINLIVGGSSL